MMSSRFVTGAVLVGLLQLPPLCWPRRDARARGGDHGGGNRGGDRFLVATAAVSAGPKGARTYQSSRAPERRSYDSGRQQQVQSRQSTAPRQYNNSNNSAPRQYTAPRQYNNNAARQYSAPRAYNNGSYNNGNRRYDAPRQLHGAACLQQRPVVLEPRLCRAATRPVLPQRLQRLPRLQQLLPSLHQLQPALRLRRLPRRLWLRRRLPAHPYRDRRRRGGRTTTARTSASASTTGPAASTTTAIRRAPTTTRSRAGTYGGVRITEAPRDAQVFADGYYVGIVDDFDGAFQHVNLEAGQHRIEVRAGGVEPVSFDVYVQPGRTITLRADDYNDGYAGNADGNGDGY